MHPPNIASLTAPGPGLPRVPLSQASLNTPQAFASSSGSPPPSTASTNTGEIAIACNVCILVVQPVQRITCRVDFIFCTFLDIKVLADSPWNFELLYQRLCSGFVTACCANEGFNLCLSEKVL